MMAIQNATDPIQNVEFQAFVRDSGIPGRDNEARLYSYGITKELAG